MPMTGVRLCVAHKPLHSRSLLVHVVCALRFHILLAVDNLGTQDYGNCCFLLFDLNCIFSGQLQFRIPVIKFQGTVSQVTPLELYI